jgi:hypothetical protein
MSKLPAEVPQRPVTLQMASERVLIQLVHQVSSERCSKSSGDDLGSGISQDNARVINVNRSCHLVQEARVWVISNVKATYSAGMGSA